VIRRLISFWDEREPPHALAAVRILVALVTLFDLAVIGSEGLPEWLWAPLADGGTSPAADPDNGAFVYRLIWSLGIGAVGLWAILCVSLVCFGAGLFTRTAGFVFVFTYAASAAVNDPADRGIDRAIRIVILILSFSAAGKVWSLDAWRKTRRRAAQSSEQGFRGDDALASAWPRYLVFAQLIITYAAAGLSKGSPLWLPWGGYAALYVILRDPVYANADYSFLSEPFPYFVSQVATGFTHAWEILAPVLLLAVYFRRTSDRPGRLRAFFNRVRYRDVYIAFGVMFHLSLAFTMRLGIFPFAMLAFYPALFRPAEVASVVERARGLLARIVSLRRVAASKAP
jgi:hypothetical protein